MRTSSVAIIAAHRGFLFAAILSICLLCLQRQPPCFNCTASTLRLFNPSTIPIPFFIRHSSFFIHCIRHALDPRCPAIMPRRVPVHFHFTSRRRRPKQPNPQPSTINQPHPTNVGPTDERQPGRAVRRSTRHARKFAESQGRLVRRRAAY